MAAGNPVCDSERGRRKRPRTGEGGVGGIHTIAGVPGTQREDESETHGFSDFCGISCWQEIVLPGFGN